MVRELKARNVGVGVFEVDDHQLLVLVGWEQQRRFALRHHAENVAVLRLCAVVSWQIFE